MVNKYDFADFAKCYENENFKCAASVVYNCLYNSLSDEMALDPLYKANLESLFMGMHKDGIKFDTVSSFQGIVIKIHTVVITTGGFNLTESLN